VLNPKGTKMDENTLRERMNLFLNVATVVVRMTSTKADDQILEVAKNLLEQDWFVKLLVFLVEKFGEKKSVSLEDVVEALKTA
jgi:hypothetical protein